MFKRLRERIAEEATKFPVGQLGNNTGKPFPEPENKSTQNNSTEDLITLSDSSSVVVPHTSPQQFSIGEEEDGSLSEQSTPQKNKNASSVSSGPQYSSGTINFADLSFGQEYRPSKKISYVPQSDIESEREDPPTLNLDGISKDQLMAAIQSLKAKSYKYKNKYAEVVKNYKELRDEKNKIETTLIENQDKGLRRIAELREQCQLEQKAKAHLEENLRLLLEEKDSRICVLETQINLLKEGGKSNSTKSLPDDCDSHYSDGGNGDTRSEDSISLSNDVTILQEKVERQQHQINQDKKTITSQRDHISLLKKQNENLSQELEEKMKSLNSLEDEQLKLRSEQEVVLRTLQDRLKELEKREEDTVMAMAETKKNMHVELELKEKQLKKADEEVKQYQAVAEREKELHSELRKQHEEKVNELTRQLELTEKTLEEEKQSLLQELAHGKTAAINLMQQECAKKIAAVEDEWKTKWEALQSSCEKTSQSQVEELSASLSDATEKLKKSESRIEELDSLVSVLEKENASLKNSVEKLESELSQSSANIEKLKSSYSDYESLKDKENSLKIQEALNEELNDKITKYAIIEQELKNQYEALCDQLNEKKVLIANLENDKRDLIEKIKILESSQKDLKTLCASLENELSVLEENFKEEKNKVVDLKEENMKKSEDIDHLNENLNKVRTNEKLVAEKLSMSLAETREFETENADLLLNNRLLTDEIEALKHSLHIKDKEINFLTENFSKAGKEINVLMEALVMKEVQIKHAMMSYKQVECLSASLQEQQISMKSALESLQIICESTVNKSNCMSEVIESFDVVQLQSILKSLKKVSGGNNVSEDACASSNKNKGDNDSVLTSETQVPCEKVNEMATSTNNKVDSESLEAQSLLDIIDALKNENISLKEEIGACKTSAEQQDVEFAKNITILQQSLSDLQEERNNLSLVLQSIESTQTDNSNKNEQNNVQTKGRTEDLDEDSLHQNCVARITSLNAKVKSEIEALSAQTEAVNKELKYLRDQFMSNRDSSSEKIKQLSSKLLFRTELLINVKGDLDSAVQSTNTFKELLEKFQKDLDEKNTLVSELENRNNELESKLKSLKAEYYNKECSLKEAHNCQLIELKNQTELTIEKLSNQIKQLNKQLSDKEDQQNLKFTNAELNYQKQISELNDQFHKTINVKKDINEFTKICDSFETKIMDSTCKLDIYCSKIVSLNDKIMIFSLKLKEKDDIIANQNVSLSDLREKLKNYGELQKEFNNLQNELKTASRLLVEANEALENEKNNFKSSESKISKLETDYCNAVKKIENLSRNVDEKNDIQSKLNSTLQEQEVLKEKHNETLSVIKSKDSQHQELQEKYSKAVNEIDTLKDQIKLLEVRTLSNNELSDCFSAISTVVGYTNKLFDEHKLKTHGMLEEKEIQLRTVESKLCTVSSKYDSKLKEISDYAAKIATHIKDTESIKQSLEVERDKIKGLESAILEWKSKYEKSVDEISELMSSKEESIHLLEKKEAELNDMKSKLVTCENEIENYKLKIVEIPTLKDKLGKNEIDLQNYLKKLSELNQTISSVENERSQWKLKFEKSIHEIDVLSVSNKDNSRLLEEQEIQLNGMKSQLTVAKEEIKNLKSQINDTATLHDKLKQNEEELLKCQKLLKGQAEKEIALENEKENLKSKLTSAEEEIKNLKSQISDTATLHDKLKQNEQQLLEFKNLLNGQAEKEIALENENENLKTKLTNAEEEIKNLKLQIGETSTLHDKLKQNEEELQECHKLLNRQAEKETALRNENQNLKSKLTNAEEEIRMLKLKITEISVLQDELNESKVEQQKCQKLLSEQTEKLVVIENEKEDWKSKFETELKNYEKTSAEATKHKENVKKLVLELKAKNAKVKSLTEELRITEKNQKLAIEKLENKIEELKLEAKSLSQSLLEKENNIDAKETEKKNLEAHHEESLKCMKDKLQNAEKNYKTQIEEMKSRISQLEKENSSLKSERENLLGIQNQLKDLKNAEEKIQNELKSKNEQLKVLQEKLEVTNKEQVEKSHTFQETMKDKENMILKLKNNIESMSKDHKESVEDLNKKIKRLEVEREQLMLQAQERVSATEAKCREDIKSLQEKNEKLLLENKEIENLRNQIALLNSQLDESLLVAESNQASANKEIALLKERLINSEKKLTEVEKSKLISESDFTQKLERLQQENKLLLHNSDHVEKLKAEKEELNEKLKTAVQQVNKIDALQTEKESLRKENDKLLAEVKNLRTVENEIASLKNKLETLQVNESLLVKQNEELTSESEKLKTELLSLKDSFKSEKDSLLSEKEKLLNQIQQLESCVSDSQNVSVKDYVDSLKKEYETAIKAKDDDMLVKLKQLVRDFSIQMDVKDKDSEQMISELMEKNEFLEEKLQKEHAVEIAALRQDLFEKDCALEEMRDSYEETIQEKNAKIKEQELKIKSLSSRDNCAASDSAHGTSEHSDWDDSWVVPDEVAEHSSPNRNTCDAHVKEIETLQEELTKCNSEIKELKVLLRLSPPDSMVNNNNRRDSVQSLPEPTEFEYLKNIIYEYMMGKEPVTLAKVIAAVLRFSDVQTQQVIRREEARHPTK